MNTSFLRAIAVSVVAGALFGPVDAGASVVGPGQTVQFAAISGFTVPPGAVVGDSTKDFTVDFRDADSNLLASADGTLHSQVLRRTDGMLTFVYNFDMLGPGGTPIGEEGGDTTVASFKNFTTDVSGIFQHGGNPFPEISRSSDGITITFGGQGNGAPTANSPLIVVATDATHFDANGHATLAAVDEFPGGDSLVLGTGSADFAGVFQPTHESGPVPIPLPPAAYAGLGMLMTIVAGCTIRRKRA